MASTNQKSPPVEIELKYSLTRSEYLRLKHFLKSSPHKNKTQTNYYFDSLALGLRKKRIGLRIRTVGSRKAIVTIKFPKPTKKGSISSLKVRYEYEAPIPIEAARQIIRGKKGIENLKNEPISVLKSKIPATLLKRLTCLGGLKTKRTTYRYHKDFILEVDESSFLGKTFYELEAETKKPKKTDATIRKIFMKAKVKCRPEDTSKLQRFLKEWKRIKEKA